MLLVKCEATIDGHLSSQHDLCGFVDERSSRVSLFPGPKSCATVSLFEGFEIFHAHLVGCEFCLITDVHGPNERPDVWIKACNNVCGILPRNATMNFTLTDLS